MRGQLCDSWCAPLSGPTFGHVHIQKTLRQGLATLQQRSSLWAEVLCQEGIESPHGADAIADAPHQLCVLQDVGAEGRPMHLEDLLQDANAAKDLEEAYAQTPHVRNAALVLGGSDDLWCNEGDRAVLLCARVPLLDDNARVEVCELDGHRLGGLGNHVVLRLHVQVTDEGTSVEVTDGNEHLVDDALQLLEGKWPEKLPGGLLSGQEPFVEILGSCVLHTKYQLTPGVVDVDELDEIGVLPFFAANLKHNFQHLLHPLDGLHAPHH
mmetsp:Transcript_79535/g.184601  ORF Transcript_79535/g.184601 Transcript_79535/m.184601 type:complete len:267 (+) Transcript_79535:72-872(+)